VLIDVLLVVGDDGLGDGLADGVDLGGVTTTGDTDTDVDTGELVSADDQERLVDLFALSSDSVFPFVLFPSQNNATLSVGFCSRTLKRRISGWTRPRGWPLTLMRPLPCC
jgi:hypothetical protein